MAIKFWSVGCSFADGVGLNNQNNRYGQLVADQLGLQAQFLTRAGSSVDWAHNQIVMNDIQKHDIVVWGITSLERFSFFYHDHDHTLSLFVNSAVIGTKTFGDYQSALEILFTSNHWTIQHVQLIQQIQLIARRVGFDLILLFHPELSTKAHGELLHYRLTNTGDLLIPRTGENVSWNGTWPPENSFLDRGNDGSHPGPKTHRAWADQILSFIKERNRA